MILAGTCTDGAHITSSIGYYLRVAQVVLGTRLITDELSVEAGHLKHSPTLSYTMLEV